MHCYFAPMEGLTDSVYRRLHHRHFPGVDRYYMPFLSPTIHRALTKKEQRELPLANSESFVAIPQLLTRSAEDFLWASQVCLDRGYEEVNLNLGCPSGTVVAKGKGSGMLADPENLERFLDEIFARTPIPISVKTRLGLEDPEEFPRLLELFDRYPIRELTIHPRTRKQFYNGQLHMAQFAYAAAHSKNPLCFNGELSCTEDIAAFGREFPGISAVMIGRGLIADPGMLTPGGTDVAVLEAFLGELLDTYTEEFGGSRNAMFRLKENWMYLSTRFVGGEKLFKRLRKTTDVAEYRSITAEIFHTLPHKPAP